MMTLVTGKNEFAIKLHVDEQISRFVKKHGADGIERRRGSDIQRSDIPDLFGGISMFSNERLVIIDNPGQSKELADYLADNAGAIPEELNLTLIEPQPDKRMKWYKSVKKHGQIIDYPELKPYELKNWVTKTVKDRGGSIQPSVAAYLVDRAGTDQWLLHNEINKLLSLSQTITTESVDQLVEPSLNETIFQLIDSAMQGREKQAVQLYESLSLREVDPYQTVSMLGWQVHNMLLVKTNPNLSQGELASKGQMAPFVVQKIKNLVKSMNLAQIKQLIDLILQAEQDIKTTGSDAHRRVLLLINQVSRVTTSS